VLPEPAAGVLERYLSRLDADAPGIVQGLYVVGSIALGGFRPGRSDIDFVATLSRPGAADTLNALRRAHLLSYRRAVARAVGTRTWPLACNGFFLAEAADLSHPPSDVSPVAAQVAGKFLPGARFDVNPVTWWTLAQHGVVVRGPDRDELSVHLDEAELRRWTAANLVSYWRPWARRVAGRGPRSWGASYRQLSIRRLAAYGVLGTARMHATITTGEVITKERAGEYALANFDQSWHPIIHDALAYWRGLPPRPGRPGRTLRAETADFVRHIIELVGAARAPLTAPAES
jgi:Domain of unknown function (DUF4111)/Nucleotidyltransferase domain